VLDAKMAPLFPGVAEIGMFGMNKGLARHFQPAQRGSRHTCMHMSASASHELGLAMGADIATVTLT
jgi:hypothetical protein